MRDRLERIEHQLEKINAAPLLSRPAMAQRLIGDVVKLQHNIIDAIDDLHGRLVLLEGHQ